MRDSEIEQQVLKEISLTTIGSLKEICVWSSTGVVRLKGSVQGRDAKLAAQAAAGRANGVIAVINDLKTRPSSLGLTR